MQVSLDDTLLAVSQTIASCLEASLLPAGGTPVGACSVIIDHKPASASDLTHSRITLGQWEVNLME